MARDFNGVDNAGKVIEYTEIADLFQGTRDTMFCWFNAESDGQGSVGKIISSKPDSNTGHRDLNLQNDSAPNTQIRFFGAFSTTSGEWITGVDISLNVWHPLGLDYDDTDVNENPIMYVDGVSDTLTEDVTPVGTPASVTQNFMIGARKDAGASRRTFDGLIAQVAAWKGVLSSVHQAALGRGVNPFIMRNDILVLYVPLYGNDDPEPNEGIAGNTCDIIGAIKGVNPPVELLENFL